MISNFRSYSFSVTDIFTFFYKLLQPFWYQENNKKLPNYMPLSQDLATYLCITHSVVALLLLNTVYYKLT